MLVSTGQESSCPHARLSYVLLRREVSLVVWPLQPCRGGPPYKSLPGPGDLESPKSLRAFHRETPETVNVRGFRALMPARTCLFLSETGGILF